MGSCVAPKSKQVVDLNYNTAKKQTPVMPTPPKIRDSTQKVSDHSFFSEEMLPIEVQAATTLFKQKRYSQAIALYEQYIQRHIDEKVDIDGLGQYQQSNCYYQWFPYEWYRDGIRKGLYRGTVYDALSLCFMAIRDHSWEMQNGIKWYRSMIDIYPERHELLFGYACVLNNHLFFDQALDYYQKTIQLRSGWAPPYECIAYIYEYKRVQKSKAVEFANKLLALEQKNRPALFILARNQQQPEQKIIKLKQLYSLYPEYVRAANQIGIIYGGKIRNYNEAINWYQKCLQSRPMFLACFNNIGINYMLKKDIQSAKHWLFQAIKMDRQYLPPHKNISDIFDYLKFTEDDIANLIKQSKISQDYFYYELAYVYRQKRMFDTSLKFYKKAIKCANELQNIMAQVYNSIGALLEERQETSLAIQFYLKSLNRDRSNQITYFNLGNAYKKQRKLDEAKQAYIKAIQINPRYSYACNNLANTYKNNRNFEEAIKYYKMAVKHNSTYTLAWANMGVSYLQLENYRDAFKAIQRAKDILNNDQNSLSQGNKRFLQETLEKFDREGQKWSQNGGITQQIRLKLQDLIMSFQFSFTQLYTSTGKQPTNLQKVFKPTLIQIVKIVQECQFQLTHIDKIFGLVRELYQENQEYFHIIPQLFMQQAFTQQKPILEIQASLFQIIKRLSANVTRNFKPEASDIMERYREFKFKLKNFDPPESFKVNIFKNVVYFKDYAEIFNQIMTVNNAAKQCYKQFRQMVECVRKVSYGIPYGVGMKIPSQEKDQFKVILRIFQKMFKKELTQERVRSIIGKIDESLTTKKQKDQFSLIDMVRTIMETWTAEITQILTARKQQKVQTKCEISDLLRGKVMFQSVDHIKKALSATDEICKSKGYQIIELQNRLAKEQTQDIVLKIQIKEVVCEFQLALKQQQSHYHFVHAVYEIERSPLGCIFGSFIYMSRDISYSFLQNCKDIVQNIQSGKVGMDQITLKAAKYIVDTLSRSLSK